MRERYVAQFIKFHLFHDNARVYLCISLMEEHTLLEQVRSFSHKLSSYLSWLADSPCLPVAPIHPEKPTLSIAARSRVCCGVSVKKPARVAIELL